MDCMCVVCRCDDVGEQFYVEIKLVGESCISCNMNLCNYNWNLFMFYITNLQKFVHYNFRFVFC